MITLNKICIWGNDWLKPSTLEDLLMVWLLASERAQKSGIDNLKTNEVFLSSNKSSIQISTLKLRRMSKKPHSKPRSADVISPIYKKNTPVFKVYNYWLQLHINAHNSIRNFNPNYSFIFRNGITNGSIVHHKSKNFPNSMLPLELLSVSGTAWQDTFLKDAGKEAQREALAFIAIMKNRVELNRQNPKKIISIPISPIGQSLVVEQELNNNNTNSFSFIEAETMGHSETTGHTYKDGFRKIEVEEIIEPIHSFARKLGDKKIDLAHEVAKRLVASNRKVTFTELEKLCGVESSSIDQLELLSSLDDSDKLTIVGEILLEGKTFIVETEMTAALMWGYIKHLEEFLPKLNISDRNETFIRHYAKLIYLHLTFKRFDIKLQLAGRQMAKSIVFPFPSLI